MQKRGLSQEGLKLIACITMLLDHIGATILLACLHWYTGADRALLLTWYEILRTIGRISFPIYCFLLSEGTVYTRNPKRYGLRLLGLMILSEIPYDLTFYGTVNWQHQNVMLTLLLGFYMLQMMEKCNAMLLKLLILLPFAMLSEWLRADYGAEGILVIALFALTRELPHRSILQFLTLWFIFSPDHRMLLNWFDRFSISMQEWAAMAVVPIALYRGDKVTDSKVVRTGFYLFYPVHLLVLYMIGRL